MSWSWDMTELIVLLIQLSSGVLASPSYQVNLGRQCQNTACQKSVILFQFTPCTVKVSCTSLVVVVSLCNICIHVVVDVLTSMPITHAMAMDRCDFTADSHGKVTAHLGLALALAKGLGRDNRELTFTNSYKNNNLYVSFLITYHKICIHDNVCSQISQIVKAWQS